MTQETFFPVGWQCGRMRGVTNLSASCEYQPAEPDIGLHSPGFVVHSAGLELTGELLIALGKQPDGLITLDVDGIPTRVPYSIETLSVFEGYWTLDSLTLDSAISEAVYRQESAA